MGRGGRMGGRGWEGEGGRMRRGGGGGQEGGSEGEGEGEGERRREERTPLTRSSGPSPGALHEGEGMDRGISQRRFVPSHPPRKLPKQRLRERSLRR